MEDKIHVMLVDDHKVLRDGLRVLLESESDLTVVAEAGDVEEALKLAETHNPDVVIMDLGLPGGGGLSAIKQLRTRQFPGKIVVLSMHANRELILEAMEAGSNGYVPKSSAHENLLDAIRVVHAGERFLHPIAASAVVDELFDKKDQQQLLKSLSDREQEVVKFTALGFSSREIGQKLNLSPKTVETYRQRAMEKLCFQHRSEIVMFAVDAGLIGN
jgi:two-component system response regulator NreC